MTDTQNKHQTKKQRVNAVAQEIDRLLDQDPNDVDSETLRWQKNLLNQMFKRLLEDPEARLNWLHSFAQYRLALYSQNQFLRTLQLEKKLEADEAALQRILSRPEFSTKSMAAKQSQK